MIVLTLAGRFVAWLAGAQATLLYNDALVYLVPETSWLYRWFFKRYNMAAFTWGASILRVAVSETFLVTLLAHEYVHVEQARRYGIIFPLLYGWESLKAALRGENAYAGNRFEKEAYGSTHDL